MLCVLLTYFLPKISISLNFKPNEVDVIFTSNLNMCMSRYKHRVLALAKPKGEHLSSGLVYPKKKNRQQFGLWWNGRKNFEELPVTLKCLCKELHGHLHVHYSLEASSTVVQKLHMSRRVLCYRRGCFNSWMSVHTNQMGARHNTTLLAKPLQ